MTGGKKKKWIKKATENKGALHRNLGVPEGEKIPGSKLEEGAHSENSKVRREVALAKTLKGLHHGLKKKMYGRN